MFAFLHSLAFNNHFADAVIYFMAVIVPFIVFFGAFAVVLLMPKKQKGKTWLSVLPSRVAKSVHIFFTTGIAYLVSAILKNIFAVQRPFEAMASVKPLFMESGASFPSGHATAFAALATAVYFHNPRIGKYFWVMAFFIAISRVIAGVHYPRDIVAGLILGGLIGYAMNRLWVKIVKVTTY